MEHGFDSRRRYNAIVADILKLWRFRLVARTHASHAWNTGSIPVGATKKQIRENWWLGHMPLTPCLFTNTRSIPVGATRCLNVFIKRRFRLVARTHASHAWNTGSIPVGATSVRTLSGSNFFCLYICKNRLPLQICTFRMNIV